MGDDKKKIWAPLLGWAAKEDEEAERGFSFHGEEGEPAGWKTSRALQGGPGCYSSKQGEQQQGRHGRGGAELPVAAAFARGRKKGAAGLCEKFWAPWRNAGRASGPRRQIFPE
jgi:hypothetical protein